MTNSSAPGPGPSAQIAAEIRRLRKGRGLQAPNLTARLGPYLRELAGGLRDPAPEQQRQALIAEISSCSAKLAADLRTAVLASLAVSDETRQMINLQQRVEWLAAWLDRDYRTALRRIDMAEELLGEEVAAELRRRRGPKPDLAGGWYLDEFRTLLRLDTAAPESYEDRRIVATQPSLREVVAWMDVPPADGQSGPALTAEVRYGGRLIRRQQPTSNCFQFVVELPEALQPGQAHEYGLIMRLPSHEHMRPHYIFTPECQCNLFDLRVRFDQSRPPGWLRRVDGETVRTFDAFGNGRKELELDSAGEAHASFTRPAMYLGYGLQWGS